MGTAYLLAGDGSSIFWENEMLDYVFEELRELNLCDSGNRFSLDWLDMNESYWRTIRAKQAKPSVKVIARCGNKLHQRGQAFLQSDFDVIRNKGQRLTELGQKCFQEAIRQSVY